MTPWIQHVRKWKDCTNCPLCQQRDRICLARGTIPCDVLFIGEAPGASENAIGQPFKGPAGQLLDAIIASSLLGPEMQTTRIAMTNLVACFPAEAKGAGSNEPEHEEIMACAGRLAEFVNVAQPRLIVCVGSLSTQYVNHTDTVKCLDIVHPAAILRMPLAQKQMAVQRTTVVLKNAIERMLQTPPEEWKEWGSANLSKSKGLGQRWDAWTKDHADIDVPF